MAAHDLKTDHDPFEAVWNGTKKCEIRNNDRDFRVDDVLFLLEHNREDGSYSGRMIIALVGHIQTGYGLPDELVVMSITVSDLVTGNPC